MQSQLLLFAMIRSVVKSFKVPGVEVVASRMSNEAALTRMIDSTKKNLVILDAGPGRSHTLTWLNWQETSIYLSHNMGVSFPTS